ncbi:hypothetical protein V0U79_10320 [Hyphobacterium sp. HN65]|uniref:Uncharacterized protein n=1 Tax=Hyphobacterium lacteum TaxID=3116575 RepID=A0ABU7LS75_9PROT|nr:hypothetical protein [Hyphobacterium sp. HN65]MEE2526765.1 hypothetical protein [Hyphobacterium sp. HN65]
MGWVRFVLAALALPLVVAGFWLVFSWQSQDVPDADIPILISQPPTSCETLQSSAVAFTLRAERRLEAAPAEAYAAAADAVVASELAAIVCAPEDWADAKLRTRPPELRQAAYRRLATGSIRDLDAACAAMDESFLADGSIEALLQATGQAGFANSLKEQSEAFVCSDRPRYRIGPERPQGGGGQEEHYSQLSWTDPSVL